MARRIVRVNRTAKPTIQDSRTHPIAEQHLVRVSRTMAKPTAQDSRTHPIAEQHLVPVSRTMAKPTAQESRTHPKIAEQHLVPASRTMVRKTVRDNRTVQKIAAQLLGPALLIIDLRLRKLVTFPGKTVVQPRRKIATLLRRTITMFLGHHRQLRPSSSLGNIRARGLRTIVRRNLHRRGPKITVLRKLRR
jgi:hypothetical protein